MVRDWLGKVSLAASLFTGDQRHQLSFFSTDMVNQVSPRVRPSPSKFKNDTIGKNPD